MQFVVVVAAAEAGRVVVVLLRPEKKQGSNWGHLVMIYSVTSQCNC